MRLHCRILYLHSLISLSIKVSYHNFDMPPPGLKSGTLPSNGKYANHYPKPVQLESKPGVSSSRSI